MENENLLKKITQEWEILKIVMSLSIFSTTNPFYVKRYKSLVWRFTSIIIRYITLKNKKFFMIPLILCSIIDRVN